VLACGAWYLAESGGRTADYRTFRGTPYGQHLLASWLDPLALIQLGLFVLSATPVARVILSVAALALERDRAYVGHHHAAAGYPAAQHRHSVVMIRAG
jgi:hypothetical protein